jgi:alkylation response protein AidB-like acyl-CoA dehydrogenase
VERDLFEPEHDLFRETCRQFMEQHVIPFHDQWERDGEVDREVWRLAGKAGLLGTDVPEQYGGGGVRDFRYPVVLAEEIVRARASGLGFGLHNDVVAPYLLDLATEEQKQRWLPDFCSGDLVTAIAMTEPGAGSDLQGIQTRAVRDGEDWVLSGQKTFITNGIQADLVIVVARTDPEARHRGISLLVVEGDMPGFSRGRNLDKVGMHAQDTAELFFDEVRVPGRNLLGEEGRGFIHLMHNLPQERLAISVGAVASARDAFDDTLAYCKERTAFGKPIGTFQHNRFVLAEMATEIEIAQLYVDRQVLALNAGTLSAEDAAKGKWWTTELEKRVIDQCVQLHGGYGFMNEYRIAKAYADTRVHTIYGGTTEIMKEIVGRSLGV